MSDRKQLARQLVMEKAILDMLKDANAETRERGKEEFDSNDADSAKLGDTVIGRVRRNKASGEWRVHDWPAFEAWVRKTLPHLWIHAPRVDPRFISAVKKSGHYIDADGVILVPDGLDWVESEGDLVVTTTDDAEDLARGIIREQLKAITA